MEEMNRKKGAMYVVSKVSLSLGFFFFLIWYSYTLRFGVFAFQILLGIYLIYLVAVAGVSFIMLPFKRNRETLIKFFYFFIRGVVIVMIISLMAGGSKMFDMALKREAGNISAALEAYKKEHGRYPQEVQDAVPAIPYCPGMGIFPFGYNYVSEDDSYRLTCPGDAFMKHTYSSKDQSWRAWD